MLDLLEILPVEFATHFFKKTPPRRFQFKSDAGAENIPPCGDVSDAFPVMAVA
jgi:hypothetical protein